jgi:3'(2'), 5'-bisphosphate nucleotidase
VKSQNQLMTEVLEIAREAGKSIMRIYESGEAGQREKTDGSPLTAADMASHHAIVAGLERATPGWPVLSEESADAGYHSRQKWERFWLVDPLDGTKEFIKRNGEFTVNIALIEHGKPVMGVVYAPVLETIYYAGQGMGGFVQRGNSAAQPIRAAQHRAGEPVKVVASRSHSDERTTALLARLGNHQCISMGSSLKLCLVAEGAAHLYPRLGPTMEWDTAAAHAVVNEAGGTVCDLGGSELEYNKSDLHNPEFFVCHRNDKELFGRIIANGK